MALAYDGCQMKLALHRFLENEERAASTLIWGCAAVGAVCFVAALAAMGLLK